jgi:hypothetical protein
MYIFTYPGDGRVETSDTVDTTTLLAASRNNVKVLRVSVNRYDELKFAGTHPTKPESYVWSPISHRRIEKLDVGKRIPIQPKERS